MRYRELLSEIEEIRPPSYPSYPLNHAWHLFIIRLDTDKTGVSSDDLMEKLKLKNIGTSLHFRAVHFQ